VDVVSEEEKRLVQEWGEGGGEGSRVRAVHEKIAQRAMENPKGIAVEDQRRRISYGELEEQANQVAGWLRKRGVKGGSYVGLCLERGVDLIVTMLGVLKAGAGYIPMEQTHPAGRLGWIVGDAKPALVVAEESVRQKLESAGVAVVGMEQVKAEMAGESRSGVKEEIAEDQVAYVIYTSGTTGEPKGVAVRHGGLASYIESAVEEWGIGREDAVLQFASVSFDTAAEEVYVCLAGGGRLVVRDEQMVNTAEEFMKRCAEKGVTVLDLPTAYWHELTAQAEERGLELAGTVRLVVIGGERALAHRASQWQRRYGQQARLINTYGPTETTIVATRYEFPAGWEAQSEWDESPIGQPVNRTRVYVLDGEQQLAPVGVAGELYIGGAGVSLGYVNRLDLTAERYVPDPYSGEPGARMYASGDLVRWRAGGVLEYVGRVDGQIKVRGFRVEVGEIESVLSRHPAVREAAVLLREDTPGNRRLVAYIVGSQKDLIKVSELRKHLAAQLPDYMVPAIFVALESLPKNRNGKVDRPSLPVPDNARPELDASYVAPRDSTEQTISLIWRDVLKTDKVGINDNFFDLGGNSLALIQVRSKLRDAFQKEIPVVEMFEYSTIRALVERLNSLADDRARLQRVEERARKQKEAINRYGQVAKSVQ
jgi:amino acid adenylation domain-containing protein